MSNFDSINSFSWLECYLCKKNQTISEKLHHLPANTSRAKLWLKALNLPEDLLSLGNTRIKLKVCSKHFADNAFQTPERLRLNRNAIPTVFLSEDTNIQIEKETDASILSKKTSNNEHNISPNVCIDQIKIEAFETAKDNECEIIDNKLSKLPDESSDFDSKFCRICLRNTNLHSIFDNNIAEIISRCASIKITVDDGLSQSICSECSTEANKAYQFILKCQQLHIKKESKMRLFEEEEDLYSLPKRLEKEIYPINEELVCPIVKKTYSLKSKQHFFCNICGYKEKSQTNLIRHKHNNHKSYKCDICFKTWRSLHNLKMHKSIHSRKSIINVECI